MFDKETRILIAEDTEITRAIVRRMLEKLGFHRIVEAANGNHAWTLLEQAAKHGTPFELVVADWVMPGLSGLDLLKRMQDTPELSHAAFLMLTSHQEREQVVEAIRAGVTSYLAKPFTASSVEKKLKEAWEFAKKKKAS